MRNDLSEYLAAHTLMKIGGKTNREIIVDDPTDFVRFLPTVGMRVTYILWWERLDIDKAKTSLGGGGPRDAQDGSKFWSEVYYLDREFVENTPDDVIRYIDETRLAHKSRDLHPAFDIQEIE